MPSHYDLKINESIGHDAEAVKVTVKEAGTKVEPVEGSPDLSSVGADVKKHDMAVD